MPNISLLKSNGINRKQKDQITVSKNRRNINECEYKIVCNKDSFYSPIPLVHQTFFQLRHFFHCVWGQGCLFPSTLADEHLPASQYLIKDHLCMKIQSLAPRAIRYEKIIYQKYKKIPLVREIILFILLFFHYYKCAYSN